MNQFQYKFDSVSVLSRLGHPLGSLRRNATQIAIACAAGVVFMSAAGQASAQAALPPLQKAGNVEYVTGGFGEEMTQAFKKASADFPLALTFAEELGGGPAPYVAAVQLQIKNSQGQTVVDLPSVGPFFLAKLQPGTYTIDATLQGKTLSRTVTVGGNGSVSEVIAWKAKP